MDDFLVFGRPHIHDDEVEDVVACLRSGWLGTGASVARFEKDFAAYTGVEHVAAVSLGFAALHLSLLTLRLEPGDEVITSAMTFVGAINSIVHAAASRRSQTSIRRR